MNTQQLILDRIAAGVSKDNSVVLIHDGAWANTGKLRTLDADTLDLIASTSYDFQTDYCHFGPMTNRLAAFWYGQDASGKASWVKGSIAELVDTVVAHLLDRREVT